MATSDDIRYALRIRSTQPADRDVFELEPSMAEDAVRRRGARARWRPLIYSWLAILGVVAVGGGVLQRLGPLPTSRQAGGAAPEPDPAGPGPSFATANVSDPVPPQPAPPQPSPPPALPAPTVPPAGAPTPLAGPASVRPGSGAEKPRPSDPNGATVGGDQPTKPREPALVVLHPAGPEDGKALAQQLAAKAGLAPDQVDAGDPGTPVPRATVRFYANEDHALARRLGNELGGMGYTWQIDNRAGRPPPPGRHSAVDVYLPRR